MTRHGRSSSNTGVVEVHVEDVREPHGVDHDVGDLERGGYRPYK
jgi:hypothetical protein